MFVAVAIDVHRYKNVHVLHHRFAAHLRRAFVALGCLGCLLGQQHVLDARDNRLLQQLFVLQGVRRHVKIAGSQKQSTCNTCHSEMDVVCAEVDDEGMRKQQVDTNRGAHTSTHSTTAQTTQDTQDTQKNTYTRHPTLKQPQRQPPTDLGERGHGVDLLRLILVHLELQGLPPQRHAPEHPQRPCRTLGATVNTRETDVEGKKVNSSAIQEEQTWNASESIQMKCK